MITIISTLFQQVTLLDPNFAIVDNQDNIKEEVLNMPAQTITTDTFNDTIKDGVTLVDFWATWCPPCRMQGPIVEKLSEEYDGQAKVGKVDVDNNQDLAAQFGIQSIPTLLLFKDGELVNKFIGLQAKDVLDGALKDALA